jgi:hypothetical protein
MTQADYKAAVNDAIRTYRLAGRKFNYNDLLADIELQQISESKHKANGNGSEPERKICWCDEGKVNGRRVAIHTPTDCEYTARRSALVYEAARITTERVGNATGRNALGYKWTAEFVREVDRLAVNAGLLK